MPYKVGYRKPPKHTQFKSGQSGNLKGRPRKNNPPSEIVEKAMEEPAPKINTYRLKGLTKKQDLLDQLCKEAISGNVEKSKQLAKIVQQYLETESIEAKTKVILSVLDNNPDRAFLLTLWRKHYGTEPPKRMSVQFLKRAIAYRLQEQVFGGLKPATKKYLQKVAVAATEGRTTPLRTSVLTAGTLLLREWHGNTYEVRILQKGVEYNGKVFRSLTQVASLITGVRWSGPAFFGLRKKQ